jgi:hypothetical protein
MCNRCNYDSPDNQIYVDPLTNEYYLDIETSEWDEYDDAFVISENIFRIVLGVEGN